MATIIVSSSVWNRIYEYYENVETKYSNTWDINDTLVQINKIQWVISNFESVCVWSREPIILYWKRMGWKETWHRNSTWHFAFECERVDEQDYIFIQDAEHQDDIKESCLNTKGKIIINKQYNTMKNTRNRVRLTESQLHNVVKESVKRVLLESSDENYELAHKIMTKIEDVINNMGKGANLIAYCLSPETTAVGASPSYNMQTFHDILWPKISQWVQHCPKDGNRDYTLRQVSRMIDEGFFD